MTLPPPIQPRVDLLPLDAEEWEWKRFSCFCVAFIKALPDVRHAYSTASRARIRPADAEFEADEYVIAVTRKVSRQVRDLVRKQPAWQLLDKEDLCQVLRADVDRERLATSSRRIRHRVAPGISRAVRSARVCRAQARDCHRARHFLGSAP